MSGTASQITRTSFGEDKLFIEVERCGSMTDKDFKELSAITGRADAQTLRMVGPRPKAIVTDKDALIVLRGINFNEGQQADDMVPIRIWLNEEIIIASQNRAVKSIDAAEARLGECSSPVDFMMLIIEELFNRIESHILELDEKVDAAEDEALADPSQKRRMEIMEFRRSIIALRRYLLPQRETMMQLSRANSVLFSEDQKQALTDAYYRSARITDMLDAVRERLSLIQEEITAIMTDAINQNMYVLSIISLVFLPLGFLTGLFGINVGGMPMVADGAGALEPFGFWIIVGLCVLSAAGILIAMRIKKWI